MNAVKKTLLALLLMVSSMASAMPLFNVPTCLVQPNGDTLHCFVSGDEYYHRLHDADGYTIVQNPVTGYWVYADTVHLENKDRRMTNEGLVCRWQIVPTEYVAGVVDPHTVTGLTPNVGIDEETWRERYLALSGSKNAIAAPKTSGRNHGRMNNIVIFVRFSDQITELGTLVSSIDPILNDSSANSTSMYSYFKQVSYNKLEIVSHFFPTPYSGVISCFADIHPRSYYLPYNSVTNPGGYVGDYERTSRQQGLVRRAVNYISTQVPGTLDLDMDNDGFVDNVCLVVKGDVSASGDILWPHKSTLSDSVAYIGGKQVYNYNIQLEGAYMYFNSSTFCHEMFHTLGAPDLYHYNTNTSVSPVGNWDIMCQNPYPPQHMSAYMKWKYGNWLDSIPEITQPGTYTLHSLGDSTHDNCCYRIATSDPHQWYVLEYRDKTERFEAILPGKGLLVYRIDDRYTGCSSNHDEVYLFRPNASDATTNGTLSQAFFSGSTSRTSFTPQTNPHPWLTGGVPDPVFAITDISVPDSTISFTYAPICVAPHDLTTSNITDTSALLSWESCSGNVILQWRSSGSPVVNMVEIDGDHYFLGGLASQTMYEWRLKSICAEGDSSDFTPWNTFAMLQCTMLESVVGIQETISYHLPFNTWYKYSYSQMIYTAAEVGGPMEITALAFDYGAWNRPVINKNNCIIYLGITADSNFAEYSSGFKPFTQLVQVYEGPISCDWDWNTIELDNPFYYNGMDNLIVAIDDNSGTENSLYHRFRCTKTPGQYTSKTCYGDNINPDPANNPYTEFNEGYQYRADMRFLGCPLQAMPSFQVTVVSSDSTQGCVSGSGIYVAYSAVTVTATPATYYHFAYWLSGNDTITANPYTFSVAADRTLEAHFAIDSFAVSLNTMGGGTVIGGGIYPYGGTATIAAVPQDDHHFMYWIATGSDTITANPYTFVVTADTGFTAHFAIDSHYVSVAPNDSTIGRAFLFGLNNEILHSATFQHGYIVDIFAAPNPDMDGYQCTFLQWSDGDTNPRRQIVLTQDTTLIAIFEAQPLDGIYTPTDPLTVVRRNGGLEIIGVAGKAMAIYDIIGRCHWQGVGKEQLFIPISRPGVYLLHIEGMKVFRFSVL